MTTSMRPLTCPLDGLILSKYNNALCCDNRHSFDYAKEGYVNLLPAHYKRSKSPGDNKAMVQARKRFLSTGHYQAISQLLNKHMSASGNKKLSILDAGCGEGYYLDELKNVIGEDHQFIGLDISKWAIAAAAKKRTWAHWLVASNRKIPLEDKSLDILICAFGFPCYDEFARILKPGGKLFMLNTEQDHQIELRNLLYSDVKASQKFDLEPSKEQHLELIKTDYKHFSIHLIQDEISDLLAMTPHFYRAPKNKIEALSSLKSLDLTISVSLREFTLAAVDET